MTAYIRANVKGTDYSTSFDRVNNVLGLTLDKPDTGTYTVRISGYNVPHGPQSYALVVSGSVTVGVPPPIPIVTTGSATSVTSSSATLNGTVNPNSSTTTYYFEYGPTTSYGLTTPETDVGSGTSDVSVSANIIGLDPDTTYHFRIVAKNSYGTSYGWDYTFDTFPTSIEHDLTVNMVGSGTVALNPPGGTYDAGTGVTLTATADPGWLFCGWSGDLTGLDNPATITMNSNKSVTATFIGVELDYGLQITSLSAVDPDDISDTEGKPENLIYGLIEMEVEVASLGDTAVVIVTLPNPAPVGYKWYKYSASTGWIDFSRDVISSGTGDGAEFNGDRTEVTLYITDNDAYDDDPTGGTIKDPSGLGTAASIPEPTSTPPSDDTGYTGGGGGSGGCFIATAAFGSQMEAHVVLLREFRDRFMLTNAVGKTFVDLYYTYSPPVADFIASHDTLRAVMRWSLLPVVGVSWLALHFGPWATLALVALLLGLMGMTAAVTLRRIRLRDQA